MILPLPSSGSQRCLPSQFESGCCGSKYHIVTLQRPKQDAPAMPKGLPFSVPFSEATDNFQSRAKRYGVAIAGLNHYDSPRRSGHIAARTILGIR